MGNSLGGKKSAKVMQLNGETLKLKTPILAGEVVKDFPGHVLLKSNEVKHFGVRAKPLEPYQQLEPKGLYFLVELPRADQSNEKVPRRVRSGVINMSAKDRLESLMLSRRTVSDLSVMKSTASIVPEDESNGGVRVRMRLPKAQVEKLMKQSRDEADAAEKIVDLCMLSNNNHSADMAKANGGKINGKRLVGSQGIKPRDQRRVSFRPANDGEIQVVADS